MKHLQKLPKNDGDNVFLGTVVAFGIKPDTSEVFASFDNNGELATYVIEEGLIAQYFLEVLAEKINDVAYDVKYKNKEAKKKRLIAREDLRCRVEHGLIKFNRVSNPDVSMDFSLNRS